MALGLFLAPSPTLGQETDAEWLEDCDAHHGRRDRREVHCEVRPVEVASTGALRVEGGNGPIRVNGGGVRAVEMRARVQAYGSSEAEAREAARSVRIVVDGNRVRAEAPRDVHYSVGFIARVPAAYDLDFDIANGPLVVEDVRGRIVIDAQNGPTDLRRVGGSIQAHSANGPLTVDVVSGTLGDFDLQTANGPLTLLLPADVNARLHARSGNGPLSTSGLNVRVERPRYGPGGSIDATLGTGGPTIRAHASNGPLSIRADD
ncbi:MAG TPA: hypothetical protein VMN78_13650 [Longimicrobiales bacterium]|nr:hypothetical protein [Longimicrobiales bacterium]